MAAEETTFFVDGRRGGRIDPRDRGFQYGDGLFETIKVGDGRLEFWGRHMARLRAGCARLGIPEPDAAVLEREAAALSAGQDRAILKIIVTRGPGGRGYHVPDAVSPTRVVSRHPWPDYPDSNWDEGVRIRLCETRLSDQPALAGLKHLNRLDQVMARREWDDPGIAEGLMRDRDGDAIEGTMTNLFVVRGGVLRTPDLSRCGVAGIMRAVVLDMAGLLSIRAELGRVRLDDVTGADEVFLTNSSIGLWPVRAFEGARFAIGPVTRRIMDGLRALKKD